MSASDSSNKLKPVLRCNLILLLLVIDHETTALLWVVGKLDLVNREAEPIILPVKPTAPYDTILAEYNRKVEKKLDYGALRKKINSRVRYIQRRRKMGKKVWYE